MADTRSVPRVFVSRKIPHKGLELLASATRMGVWDQTQPMTRNEQIKAFAECDGLLTTGECRVDEEMLAACPKVRAVSNYAVGYDNIHVAACTALGVLVGNTPGVLSETTADLAFTLMLAAARRVVELAAWVKKGLWTPDMGPAQKLGTDVHHAVLGIWGMGRIGKEVAKRARGFSMKVLYHNRRRDLGAEKETGAVFVSEEELLKQSDFVSIHVPLTKDTRGLVGEEAFALMKPAAILINTARGPVVDHKALVSALKTGKIAGAGLDVTDPEPMAADDPLLLLPQVTVLPHIGSATRKTRAKMAEVAAQNLLDALSGTPMISCVNPEAAGHGRSAGRT